MVSEICRAKNPLTCHYHGSVMRMYQAQAEGNGDDYLYYRGIVEQMQRQNWDEEAAFPESQAPSTAVATVKRMVGRQVVETPATDSAVKPLPTTMKRMVGRRVVETPIPADLQQRMQASRDQEITARQQPPVTIDATRIPTSNDPALQQQNKLFDVLDAPVYAVNEKGRRIGSAKATRFYQRKAGVTPAQPANIRVQTNRVLTPEEAVALGGLLRYAYKVRVGGAPAGSAQRDTPFSFIVPADTSAANEKNSGENLPQALDKLEATYRDYITDGGSPKRKTKADTRYITTDSLKDVQVRFFYDSVIIDTPAQA